MNDKPSAPPGYEESRSQSKKKEEDDDDATEPVLNKMRTFLDNTTAHGAKRVLVAHNSIARCFWIILVSCGFCVLAFVVMQLVAKYQSHEKITSIEVRRDDFMGFPVQIIWVLHTTEIQKSCSG